MRRVGSVGGVGALVELGSLAGNEVVEVREDGASGLDGEGLEGV